MTLEDHPLGVSWESLSNAMAMALNNFESSDAQMRVAEPIRLMDGRAAAACDRIDIERILADLKRFTINKGTNLIGEKSAEFLLTEHDRIPIYARRGVLSQPSLSNDENQLEYSIGQPSREFSAFILCALINFPEGHRARIWSSVGFKVRTQRASSSDEGASGSEVTLLDAIPELLPIRTLKITSGSARRDFESLANAFLFQTAYNLDAPFSVSNGFDHLLRGSRIQRVRRVGPGGLDAPKQVYNADLVHHYIMGVSAESPLLEYLSYYHIAEHFFEKVYTDDLVDQVRKGIADPSFSIKRSKDIQGIIKIVSSAQRQTREEGGFNEQRALELVLEKYLDLVRLTADLDGYDASLVERYKTVSVEFAEAGTVGFDGADPSKVKIALARRIYKVRNALVHAKEGAKPKYAPFAHDAELAKEVTLVRFVSEQIIIASGKVF